MLLGPIAITSSLLNSLLILNKVGGLFKGGFASQLYLNCISLSAERGTQKEKKPGTLIVMCLDPQSYT